MFEDGPPPLPVVTRSSPVHHEFSPDGGLADLDDDNRLTAVADEDLDGTSHELGLAEADSRIPDFEPECFIVPSNLVPHSDANTNHSQNQTGHISHTRELETANVSSKQKGGNIEDLSPKSIENRSNSSRKPSSSNGGSFHECPIEMESDEEVCNNEIQSNLTVDSILHTHENNNSEAVEERKRPARNENENPEKIRNPVQNGYVNSNDKEIRQEGANDKLEQLNNLNESAISSLEPPGKAKDTNASDSIGQTESRGGSLKSELKAYDVDGVDEESIPSIQSVEARQVAENVPDTDFRMQSADRGDKKEPDGGESAQIQQTPSLSNSSPVKHSKTDITIESKKPNDQVFEKNASGAEMWEEKQEDNRGDVTDRNDDNNGIDDDDDDFGDFEEFGDFAEPQQPFQESKIVNEEKESSAPDGWAAFETAPSGSFVESENNHSDEWAADFSSAPAATPSMQSASKQPQMNKNLGECDELQASLPLLCNVYKDDRAKDWVVDNVEWQDENDNETDDGTSQNDSCKNELEKVLEDLEKTRHAVDSLKAWQSLWLAIGVVEEALALKMQWPHSSFYSNFLDSLNLDANLAMVRNSALPAFAQQLGDSTVLQPMTSLGDSGTDNKSKRLASSRTTPNLCNSPSETKSNISEERPSETEKNAPDSATSLQLNAPPKRLSGGTNELNSQRIPTQDLQHLRHQQQQQQQHLNQQQKRPGRHADHSKRPESDPEVVDSLAVPPAQFDWGNSGLTNPLTAGSISASSVLMDLDFLTANESRIVTIAGRSSTTADISYTLQKDLAALGLSPSTVDMPVKQHSESNGAQNCETKTVNANILEELMRKGTRGEQKYTRPSELSLDARALHDRLPDLDYMLANVLLFPMGNR